MSAPDRAFNPLRSVGGYISNAAKEVKEYGQAVGRKIGLQMDARSYPPASAGLGGPTREQKGIEANAASKAQDKAFGQLAGAVLQGRRYDNKGIQIKK